MLLQVWSQYELFLKAPDDDSLKQDFKLACQRVSPHSWLDTQVRSLTADGEATFLFQATSSWPFAPLAGLLGVIDVKGTLT